VAPVQVSRYLKSLARMRITLPSPKMAIQRSAPSDLMSRGALLPRIPMRGTGNQRRSSTSRRLERRAAASTVLERKAAIWRRGARRKGGHGGGGYGPGGGGTWGGGCRW